MKKQQHKCIMYPLCGAILFFSSDVVTVFAYNNIQQ